MPRKPRFFVPGIPCHVIQRGNNRTPIFFANQDYQAYKTWLHEAFIRYECELHAYVLMTNHVHLLITPSSKQGISLSMQYLGRYYVPYINHQYQRCGTLWESRFKASLVDSEEYLLTCMRYIELNPVRAGMVKAPGEYSWSSYKCNAYGQSDVMLSAHASYLALSDDRVKRLNIYRELFKNYIEQEDLHAIRNSAQSGTPLGNLRFKNKIENILSMHVGYTSRGRPKGENLNKGL